MPCEPFCPAALPSSQALFQVARLLFSCLFLRAGVLGGQDGSGFPQVRGSQLTRASLLVVGRLKWGAPGTSECGIHKARRRGGCPARARDPGPHSSPQGARKALPSQDSHRHMG